MTGFGTALLAGIAGVVAYATRLIGPKVRPGDEVLLSTAGLAGLPGAFQIYQVLLFRVNSAHGDALDGDVVGTAAATIGDSNVVQVVRLPAAIPLANVPEKFVLPNKFQG